MTMTTPPPFPLPADEEQRVRELERYGIIGSESDEHFDRLVTLASSILDTPMAAISLVAADRQWFLSSKGMEVRETPREVSFCTHAILQEEVLVVSDTHKDEYFCSNPLVTSSPHIRFYAGAPLRTPHGHNIGTLCVIDRKPHHLSSDQIRQLQLLADQVMRELDLRRLRHVCPVTGLATRKIFLAICDREFKRARREHQPLSLLCFDIDNFRQINIRWGHHEGDEVLADLCRLSRQFLRDQDFAGRLGDGEFALLFVGLDHEQAETLAEQLRVAVTRMKGIYTHSDFHLHISGGLSSMSPSDRSFDDLLRRADQAMELAKNNGRNQIALLLDGF